MIASTPVGRWTWGRDDQPRREIFSCIHDVLAAWFVLARYDLAIGTPGISVSVHEAGRANSLLFQGQLEPGAAIPASDIAHHLAARVEVERNPGEIGAVYADMKITGVVVTGDHATREEELFLIGSSAVLDYVSTELVTFSDAWMSYDLRGRAQTAVHAVNAPRLSAALLGLSEVLRSEIDPDEPTYFAKPTDTGIESYLEDDGAGSDVWSSFEVPYRYSQFTHAPGFGQIGYKRSAEGEVLYAPVTAPRGVLGYLWASDAEQAASFEPRDVGNDESYQSGLLWLSRLRSAHDRGLSPSEAVAELAGLLNRELSTVDMASLRELAKQELNP
ncbi:hypothetical protein [Streptomyces sp. CAI 127]|uniref:hypothetical protein n=1 Tax=Streptomyces sp. CAI 127 TaxID=1076397 RepID=UPI00158750D8|nr:hypothetical protein [Streptomyces sp. CAI 127]NUW04022.1 hypothetical protein [Streptomyces sp. CAI 127]